MPETNGQTPTAIDNGFEALERLHRIRRSMKQCDERIKELREEKEQLRVKLDSARKAASPLFCGLDDETAIQDPDYRFWVRRQGDLVELEVVTRFDFERARKSPAVADPVAESQAILGL